MKKRILLTISFDGTDYHGWQVQPNGISVQQVLQDCLEKVLGEKLPVTGCSRTDSGVHAKEFCCHLDCDAGLPDDVFLRGLNGVLPHDIAVTGCKTVDMSFHARYSSTGKTYVYYIYNSRRRDPFKSRYSWQIERPLDIGAMSRFCGEITGTHDFRGFSSAGRTVDGTVRTIRECRIEKSGSDVRLTVTGNGFLYNMVRIITGTAVSVSDNKIASGAVGEIFSTGRRELAGPTAPPKGLFLEKVWY